LKDQQEQLFRAYDTLTEKIFMFQRECDNLKVRKRQLLVMEAKVHEVVKTKFREL